MSIQDVLDKLLNLEIKVEDSNKELKTVLESKVSDLKGIVNKQEKKLLQLQEENEHLNNVVKDMEKHMPESYTENKRSDLKSASKKESQGEMSDKSKPMKAGDDGLNEGFAMLGALLGALGGQQGGEQGKKEGEEMAQGFGALMQGMMAFADGIGGALEAATKEGKIHLSLAKTGEYLTIPPNSSSLLLAPSNQKPGQTWELKEQSGSDKPPGLFCSNGKLLAINSRGDGVYATTSRGKDENDKEGNKSMFFLEPQEVDDKTLYRICTEDQKMYITFIPGTGICLREKEFPDSEQLFEMIIKITDQVADDLKEQVIKKTEAIGKKGKKEEKKPYFWKKWSPGDGVPTGAVLGGNNGNDKVYIARVELEEGVYGPGGKVAGKLHNGEVYISDTAQKREVGANDYAKKGKVSILCKTDDSTVEWLLVDGNKTIKNPGKISGAVPVQDGMWVARQLVLQNNITPGFCKNGECHSPWGGKDRVQRTYEQLLIKAPFVKEQLPELKPEEKARIPEEGDGNKLFWWEPFKPQRSAGSFCGVKDPARIPLDAVEAGNDGGRPVYIARVEMEEGVYGPGEFVVGKIHDGNVFISDESLAKERQVNDWMEQGKVFILCARPKAEVTWVDQKGDWTPGKAGLQGRVQVKPGVFVGRQDLKGSMVPGFVRDGVCHSPWGGKDNETNAYQMCVIKRSKEDKEIKKAKLEGKQGNIEGKKSGYWWEYMVYPEDMFSGPRVPDAAFKAGLNDGRDVYVGRMKLDGAMVVGTILNGDFVVGDNRTSSVIYPGHGNGKVFEVLCIGKDKMGVWEEKDSTGPGNIIDVGGRTVGRLVIPDGRDKIVDCPGYVVGGNIHTVFNKEYTKSSTYQRLRVSPKADPNNASFDEGFAMLGQLLGALGAAQGGQQGQQEGEAMGAGLGAIFGALGQVVNEPVKKEPVKEEVKKPIKEEVKNVKAAKVEGKEDGDKIEPIYWWEPYDPNVELREEACSRYDNKVCNIPARVGYPTNIVGEITPPNVSIYNMDSKTVTEFVTAGKVEYLCMKKDFIPMWKETKAKELTPHLNGFHGLVEICPGRYLGRVEDKFSIQKMQGMVLEDGLCYLWKGLSDIRDVPESSEKYEILCIQPNTWPTDYMLVKAGTKIPEGWRKVPKHHVFTKPEVKETVEAMLAHAGDALLEDLINDRIVVLTEGEEEPVNFVLVDAGTPLEEGWSKMPLGYMEDEEKRDKVMSLFTGPGMVEAWNRGEKVIHMRGENPEPPEYGFVRRTDVWDEYKVPEGWCLLPAMDYNDPGVRVFMGMVFGRDEKYCDEYNSGLLTFTLKKREGEVEKEEEDDSDDGDWDWSDSSDDDLDDDLAEMAEMMSMFGMKDNAKEMMDQLEELKELKNNPLNMFWKKMYRADTVGADGDPNVVLPKGALRVGEDGGDGVYVVSVVMKSNKDTRMIGKLHRGNVYVAHAGKEIWVRNVDDWKVFCVIDEDMKTEWVSKKVFEEKKASKDALHSVEVEGCVVGRMKTPGGDGTTYIPGWVKDGVIHAPYDRKEFTSKNYEVLCIDFK